MAFNHLTGTTTKGAADPMADWFATFEAWISLTVGWTVVAGAGTTDLWLSSIGESGTLTKLFVRVWNSVGDRINGEVADDAIPTHITAEGGYLDIDGLGEFQYRMTADLDTIIISIPYRGEDDILYLGCLEPLAITPTDETNYMVAAGPDLDNASILHHHTGVWDVDITNYGLGGVADLRRCMLGNGHFPLMPLIADRQNAIAGQYKFISAKEGDATVAPGDTLNSAVFGGNASWLRLYTGADKYALQTAGAPSGDIPQAASFTANAGPAATPQIFLAGIAVFLTGIGWTDLGDPGGPDTWNRLLHSTGDTGLRNIYVLFGYDNVQGIHIYVQDDAVGTHRTGNLYSNFPAAGNWPANFWVTADINRISLMVHRAATGHYVFQSAGVPYMTSPEIAGDEYQMYAWVDQPPVWSYLLRRRGDGVWGAAQCYYAVNGAGHLTNSNANAYDPNTYVVWPIELLDRGTATALVLDAIGTMPYIYYTNGGGIAALDTITDGAEVFTVGNSALGALGFLALRTT